MEAVLIGQNLESVGWQWRRPVLAAADPTYLVYSGAGWQRLPTDTELELVPMPDEILTLPDVAQLLKVAEKTVYTMAQKGELPAFKVRGQWRFKRDDIDAWIERQKLEAKGAK